MLEESRSRTTIFFLHARPYLAALQASVASLQAAIRAGEVEAESLQILIMVDRSYPALDSFVSAAVGVDVMLVELPWLTRARVRVTQVLAARQRLGFLSRWAQGSLKWQTSYWPKVRLATTLAQESGSATLAKCDEDIVLSPSAWRVLSREADRILMDPEILLVTPALSSGIPTWMDFAESFLDAAGLVQLLGQFRRFDLPRHIWGIDYSEVRDAQQSVLWDEDAHTRVMSEFGSCFRGYHPIRFHAAACARLAEEALIRISDFLAPVSAQQMEYRKSQQYLCNGVFAIRPSVYASILDDDSLFRDSFDEIPLNLLFQSGEWKYLIAQRALGVHFLYNSAYSESADFKGVALQGLDLEEAMAKAFLEALAGHK
jgi:hypothetical protein